LDRLQQPGNAVIISVDAYWKGGGPNLRRNFAGNRMYQFGTGAASLARLARCPIIPCVTFLEREGAVVEWGIPIPPPAANDERADIQGTDQLLQYIERGVGSRPSQYVLDIGASRRWNSSAEQWQDHE
jgi:lauroyl/myristoyl acyltransferase